MKNYNDNYQFTTNISNLFLREIKPALNGLKVLDLGCGPGEYLRQMGPGSLGVDGSTINLAAAQAKGLRVQHADLNSLIDTGERFQCVFMSHVMEHVESPINLLRYANRMLDDNGMLVVSIPNERSIIHLKHPYFTGDGNHLYSFSIENMHELLLVTEFDCDKVIYEYENAMSTRLQINSLLRLFNFMPTCVRSLGAWAYWFIAYKR